MSKQPSLFDMLTQAVSARKSINIGCDGFRMSYNPYCSDTETDETAIVIGQKIFLILDGDHRAELVCCDRDQAVAYWKDRPEQHGGTSNTLEDYEEALKNGTVK